MSNPNSKSKDWDINGWLSWKRKSLPVANQIDSIDPTDTTTTINDFFSDQIPDNSALSIQSSSSEQAPKRNSWSFWPSPSSSSNNNNSNGNGLNQDFKDILNDAATASIKSNMMYREELDLSDPNTYKSKTSSASILETQLEHTNILIPSFDESLPKDSYSNQFSTLFNNLRTMLGYNNQDHPEKLQLMRREKPNCDFNNVLIIGVHGFFPTKYVRPFIGEPTGTSAKFMTETENVFKNWLKNNKQYFDENKKLKLSKIALEKEGCIFERVEFFLNILSEFDLNEYDFIYVAAHSQGTPVSIMLMSQLIEKGLILEPNKKIIGILGMAGISNGPFHRIKQTYFVKAYSRIENESLLELFEFQDFESVQSKKYLESLKILVGNNVKIIFVGSIDDQLVPIYSSICSHVVHPNIFRSIYIDCESNTPKFLIKILDCALLLSNMGLNDHGMIKEISNALAGPLTGGGHSKIYNEHEVYETGFKFFLYSYPNKTQGSIPLKFKPFAIDKLGENPFYLPFCLRGLMDDSVQYIENGKQYVQMMLLEFDEWNPSTKVLKDLKYRLHAMKAKL